LKITLSPKVRTLLKISFLTTFAESMLVPLYAAFTESVGGSILDAGTAFAVFSIATGIAVALIGTRPWFGRRIKVFLLLGFTLSAACDVSYMFVANKWQLFGAQLVAGLATGLIEPAWDALFTDDIKQPSAGHWSIWAGGTHFSTGLAAIVGGLIVTHASFQTLFGCMALVDALAALVTWRSGLRLAHHAP
jgi:MFS family permease